MPRSDPFPQSEFLGLAELKKLLAMDRTTLYEFLKDETTGFPRPVALGKTRNGKPRERWVKWEVMAWVELVGRKEKQV